MSAADGCDRYADASCVRARGTQEAAPLYRLRAGLSDVEMIERTAVCASVGAQICLEGPFVVRRRRARPCEAAPTRARDVRDVLAAQLGAMVRNAAWARRPCAKRWTVHRRPCPWMRRGRDCRQSWGAEAPAVFFVVQALALASLVPSPRGSAFARRRLGGVASAHASFRTPRRDFGDGRSPRSVAPVEPRDAGPDDALPRSSPAGRAAEAAGAMRGALERQGARGRVLARRRSPYLGETKPVRGVGPRASSPSIQRWRRERKRA